ncbi:hypothetical protein BY458DRAFT_590961 [Sporodiniella umbellata]|nr:hypothetical protein BY458DRAFT_590961 [Sporodiniella umbellata]
MTLPLDKGSLKMLDTAVQTQALFPTFSAKEMLASRSELQPPQKYPSVPYAQYDLKKISIPLAQTNIRALLFDPFRSPRLAKSTMHRLSALLSVLNSLKHYSLNQLSVGTQILLEMSLNC